jgi:hypothetical protein
VTRLIRRGVLIFLGLMLVLPLPRAAGAETDTIRGEFSIVERMIGCEQRVRIRFRGRYVIHTTTDGERVSTAGRLVGRLAFREGDERFKGRFTQSFASRQWDTGTRLSFTFSARSKSDQGRHATFHAVSQVRESPDGEISVRFARERVRCR